MTIPERAVSSPRPLAFHTTNRYRRGQGGYSHDSHGNRVRRRGSTEGGYCARALGASIFAEGDDLSQLQAGVRDAVRCHFDQADAPKVIRLHFVRDQVISA